MKVATKRPQMTSGRAAILGLLSRYALPGYRLRKALIHFPIAPVSY
jgi:hypothetical protein